MDLVFFAEAATVSKELLHQAVLCDGMYGSTKEESEEELRSRLTSKAKVAEGHDTLLELGGLGDDLEDAILEASVVGVGRVEV